MNLSLFLVKLPAARYLCAGLATAAALGGVALLLNLTDHPWLLASLGGSCVILFGMPESEMARPRSFLGGHLIATIIGLLLLEGYDRLGGSYMAWQIGAVAFALTAMMLTRTIHSPAGANPIVVFAEHAGWSFLISPLLIGLAVLAVTAWIAPFSRRASPLAAASRSGTPTPAHTPSER